MVIAPQRTTAHIFVQLTGPHFVAICDYFILSCFDVRYPCINYKLSVFQYEKKQEKGSQKDEEERSS